jgi:hypothetical protein
MLRFPPSLLAAAALALAAKTQGAPGVGTRALCLSGYAPAEVAAAAACLLRLQRNATSPRTPSVGALLAPLLNKFSRPEWCAVALCPPLPGVAADFFA